MLLRLVSCDCLFRSTRVINAGVVHIFTHPDESVGGTIIVGVLPMNAFQHELSFKNEYCGGGHHTFSNTLIGVLQRNTFQFEMSFKNDADPYRED